MHIIDCSYTYIKTLYLSKLPNLNILFIHFYKIIHSPFRLRLFSRAFNPPWMHVLSISWFSYTDILLG